MCGLFGAFGPSLSTHGAAIERYILNAAAVDSLRGAQSTGLVHATAHSVRTFKKAVNGVEFSALHQAGELARPNVSTFAIVGHNRAATRGSVCDANAHPFVRGAITLVHNGHISNAWQVAEDAGLKHADWRVDSDTAAAALNKYADPLEALRKLDGAYSLVWIDTRNRSLNFARNAGRPMWMMPVLDKSYDGAATDDVLFASEALMIRWLAHRNGLYTGAAYQTEELTLYTHYFDEYSNVEKSTATKYTPDPLRAKPFASAGSTTTSSNASQSTYVDRKARVMAILERECIEEHAPLCMTVHNDSTFEHQPAADGTTVRGATLKLVLPTHCGELKAELRLSPTYATEKFLMEFVDAWGASGKQLGDLRLLCAGGHIYVNAMGVENCSPRELIVRGGVNLNPKIWQNSYAVIDRDGKTVLAVLVPPTGGFSAAEKLDPTSARANELVSDLWRRSNAGKYSEKQAAVQAAIQERKAKVLEYKPTPPEPGTVYRLRSVPKGEDFDDLRPGQYMAFIEVSKDAPDLWKFELMPRGGSVTVSYQRAERVRGKELRRVHKTVMN